MDNIMPPDHHRVRGPDGAIAWSPGYGFVSDPADRAALVERGATILDADSRGFIDSHGSAPLIAAMRIEREVDALHERLRNIAERAAADLAAR